MTSSTSYMIAGMILILAGALCLEGRYHDVALAAASTGAIAFIVSLGLILARYREIR